MNNCATPQSAFAACEDMRAPFAVSDDRKGVVFCPKPRRFGQLTGADPVRPLRRHVSHQAEPSESKASSELMEIFFAKGSSPPFFCGSPPSRVANPVIHDARFGEQSPLEILSPLPMESPMSPSSRKGYVRGNFGLKPAAVRVEGFDCDRQRNRSITASA